MRQLFLLSAILITFSAFAQDRFYTDFDNYSFNPALVDQENKLEADVFYQSDFTRIWGSSTDFLMQYNQSFGSNNLGLNVTRQNHYDNRTNVTTKFNYVRNFKVNENTSISPVLSVSHIYDHFKNSLYIYPQDKYHSFSTSIGIAFHHKNLSAGAYSENLITYQKEALSEPNAELNIHASYKLKLTEKLVATPFARAVVTQGERDWISSGLNIRYNQLAELWIGNEVEFSGDYSNSGKVGIGIAPISNLWFRYQYQLFYSVAGEQGWAEPSNLLGISFNLPTNATK